jgi:hypothetical protein
MDKESENVYGHGKVRVIVLSLSFGSRRRDSRLTPRHRKSRPNMLEQIFSSSHFDYPPPQRRWIRLRAGENYISQSLKRACASTRATRKETFMFSPLPSTFRPIYHNGSRGEGEKRNVKKKTRLGSRKCFHDDFFPFPSLR